MVKEVQVPLSKAKLLTIWSWQV